LGQGPWPFDLTASLLGFGFGFDGVSQDMAKHSSPPHPAHTGDRSFEIGWDGTRQDKAWIRRHWGLFSFFSWGFYAKFGFLAGTNFIAAVFEFWRMMAFKDEWGVCR
jgi:hypothetical protein